jgi:hypothetical protein
VCDTEDVQSFNRGYLLAHTGFNLFISLQELGIARVNGPHGGLPNETQRKRKFIQFGRSALLNIWTPSRLKSLLETRQAMRALPNGLLNKVLKPNRYVVPTPEVWRGRSKGPAAWLRRSAQKAILNIARVARSAWVSDWEAYRTR